MLTGPPVLHLILLSLPLQTAVPLPNSGRWDSHHAAHLLRRAGFGGTPEEIASFARLGRAKAVERLLAFAPSDADDRQLRLAHAPPPNPLHHPDANREELEQLRALHRREEARAMRRVLGWWIERLVSSPRPLEEKLVLFWHGHFTSGFREVQSSWAMYEQNQLFRRHAAGNFRDLLMAVTYDPAMILYLNTQQNRKDHPNENYARELMELFTLGTGHYGEHDIKEAARALTGIHLDPRTGRVVFLARQHDDGVKRVLGVTGRLGPEDVIEIILRQPATAEQLVRKLWTFFAYEEPEPFVVKALAKVLRDSRYELRPLLRAMFLCDAFYSRRAMFTHVKSPVELLVGTCRVLELSPVDTDALNHALRNMGQQLMQPPNVKGWDGGATWITASTLFNRYNAVAELIEGNDNAATRTRRRMFRRMAEEDAGKEATEMMAGEELDRFQPTYDPLPVLAANGLERADEIVDYYVRRLLQRKISADTRKSLIDALEEELATRTQSPDDRAAAVRVVLRLITSMPEYQLS